MKKLISWTPEWVQIHLPPVLIAFVGVVIAIVILGNQFIRQTEITLFEHLEKAYESEYIQVNGSIDLVSSNETTTYPLNANISFVDTQFPIIDLPENLVQETPFGSFEGVRIYPERTYGRLAEASDYWVTVDTSEFVDYTYQRFFQSYVPNFFASPHSEFWLETFATNSQAKNFLQNHLRSGSMRLSQTSDGIRITIKPQSFRDVSIKYFESKNQQTLSVSDRKWYEDMTTMIPSEIVLSENGAVTLKIDSQFFQKDERIDTILITLETQSTVAVDFREPAEKRYITDVPQEVIFTSPMKALAIRELQRAETLAQELEAGSISSNIEETDEMLSEAEIISDEEDSDSSELAEETENTPNANSANIFQTQLERYRQRTWSSN